MASEGQALVEVAMLGLNCKEETVKLAFCFRFLFEVSGCCSDPPSRPAVRSLRHLIRCDVEVVQTASAKLRDLEVPVYLYGVNGR